MSSRLWPAKQSILPVIPTTPVTIRLNLNCHKLNHPTRKHLFRDDDNVTKKPIKEQVLSKRKDHTIPTRWSLYRPLIHNARQVDAILANRRDGERSSTSSRQVGCQRPDRVLTRHIRCQWRRKQSMQGYQQVRDWLTVEYELLEDLQRAVQGDEAIIERFNARIIASLDTARARNDRRTKRKRKPVPSSQRPMVHPSFLAPSLFNIALPRMKPQPLTLSMMMDDRVKRRDRRRENQERHKQWAQDMVIEERFWRDLGLEKSQLNPISTRNGQQVRLGQRGRMDSDEGDLSFTERHYRHVNLIATYFDRDAARAATTYTPAMISAVKDARKAREQRRQRRSAKRKVNYVGSLEATSK